MGPLTRVIALAALLFIPFRIIAQGFLPDDDVLADAAKAVTDRPWTDILVLKPEFALDQHVGWHALPRVLHVSTGWGPHGLVNAAVIGLFVLLSWSAVWWVKRAVLAGRSDCTSAFAASWGIAIVVGAVLTGHPIGYLMESVRMGLEALGKHVYESMLVPEFQPMADNLTGLMLIAGVALFRRLVPNGDATRRPLHRDPAFVLGCIGWALGYKAMRFWGDWGLVALLVVMAAELDRVLTARMAKGDGRRVLVAAALAATLFLVDTSDSESRWSGRPGRGSSVGDGPRAHRLAPRSGRDSLLGGDGDLLPDLLPEPRRAVAVHDRLRAGDDAGRGLPGVPDDHVVPRQSGGVPAVDPEAAAGGSAGAALAAGAGSAGCGVEERAGGVDRAGEEGGELMPGLFAGA